MIVILKSSLKTSFPRLNATYCEVIFRLISLEVTTDKDPFNYGCGSGLFVGDIL